MLLEKQMMTTAQLMTAIKKNYNMVTPVVLSAIFGHNDGGKLIRRHLRAKFIEPNNHAHGANWAWTATDDTLKTIVEYAYALWAINDEWAKKIANK